MVGKKKKQRKEATEGVSSLADALVQRDAAAYAAKEEAKREELRRERVRNMQKSFKNSAVGDVQQRSSRARYIAARFYRVVSGTWGETLKCDIRMPQTINYTQRYQAFVRMQDRSRMLLRLEQTVRLAGKILESARKLDPDAACRDTARGLWADMQLSADVAMPSVVVEEDTTDGPFPLSGAKPVVQSLEEVLQNTFEKSAQSFAEITEEEVDDEQFNRFCNRLLSELDNVFRAFVEQQAHSVEGKRLNPSALERYKGEVTFEFTYDPAEVYRLYEEVLKSFATFKQVVMDNGLFSAFLDDDSYGRCSGFSYGWIGDFGEEVISQYYGSSSPRSSGIPSVVEEDEGGDSVKRAIDRMVQFNAKRYFGMLDDDFAFHVQAFWYGFRKLMEFTNDLVVVDTSAYRDYLWSTLETIKDQAALLGASANDGQLDGWDESFSELENAYRERHQNTSPQSGH